LSLRLAISWACFFGPLLLRCSSGAASLGDKNKTPAVAAGVAGVGVASPVGVLAFRVFGAVASIVAFFLSWSLVVVRPIGS